ncbi:hypothetical protein E4U11_002990 [Claviceps purpurea]|nr:hypothetical protein E4U11_002990 [Claviceps purpurea]
MADGTTTPPAAATGRVTPSTAQAAASTSSASHDTAEYLRLSRFADYVTAAWQDRYATINQHSTTLDIDNKRATATREYWTIHTWEKASSRPRQEMRDFLEVNGIYVGKGSGSKIAENLHRVVSRYMCDDDGDIEQAKGPRRIHTSTSKVTSLLTMVTTALNLSSNSSNHAYTQPSRISSNNFKLRYKSLN